MCGGEPHLRQPLASPRLGMPATMASKNLVSAMVKPVGRRPLPMAVWLLGLLEVSLNLHFLGWPPSNDADVFSPLDASCDLDCVGWHGTSSATGRVFRLRALNSLENDRREGHEHIASFAGHTVCSAVTPLAAMDGHADAFTSLAACAPLSLSDSTSPLDLTPSNEPSEHALLESRPIGIFDAGAELWHEGYAMNNAWQNKVDGVRAWVAAGAQREHREEGVWYSVWESPGSVLPGLCRCPKESGRFAS